MGETSIEWTDSTWNPVRGCSRVSPGCENCYAEKTALRFSGVGQPFEGFVRLSKKGAQWTGRVDLRAEHLADPLRWRKPRRVFVNSMSDLFHEELPNESIAAVFGVMAAASQHTFQILTKRPERMRAWFAWVEAREQHTATPRMIVHAEAFAHAPIVALKPSIPYAGPWPLPNIWLGVSVEDQKTADERIPILLETPAAVRFVSYEPALGPVDFTNIATMNALSDDRDGFSHGRTIDWIIVGGESGPGARPFDVAWARSTVTQCKAAGVACFVKQLGADVRTRNDDNFTDDGERDCWPLHLIDEDRIESDVHGFREGHQGAQVRVRLRDRKGGDMAEWSPDLRVREFPR